MSRSPKKNETDFKAYIQRKIIFPDALEAQVEQIKKESKTIATLNGSFDLFHAGHLEILYQASMQADVLIVALNSDQSVKQYKSPLRPIIPLEYRLEVIASLEFVDYVTWFDEVDPCVLLEKIQPHVHVNGAEYGENCIEASTVKAYGGRIHLVQRIEGLDTSEIIKKILVCG